MKVLKNGIQRNVVLNQRYYTLNQLNEMLERKEVFYLNKNIQISYQILNDYLEETLRIGLEMGDELKVIYDKINNIYTTVLIKNGINYYVEL